MLTARDVFTRRSRTRLAFISGLPLYSARPGEDLRAAPSVAIERLLQAGVISVRLLNTREEDLSASSFRSD